MYSESSDSDLLVMFSKGSIEAFEALMNRYSAKVYNLASRIVQSPEDAEEVLQEVFSSVFNRVEKFEGKSSFSSWIYRVAVNTSLMKLRKRRRTRTVLLDDLVPENAELVFKQLITEHTADKDFDSKILAKALEVALKKLPDDYRPAYVLKDIDGLSCKEVSKLLRLSVPTVKSRVHRSRMFMRRNLMPLYREYTSASYYQQSSR